MQIKKGDSVEVIDESIIGRVLKINEKEVTFITDDGFEMTFPITDVIPLAEKPPVGYAKISAALADKEAKNRKKTVPPLKKQRNDPRMEVDLHIEKLVKSFRGMNNFDILSLQLETAERQLNFAMSKKIQKVVFIHGVGEGVLKSELEYLFGRYNNVKFYDADYTRYGTGATEVYILQNS